MLIERLKMVVVVILEKFNELIKQISYDLKRSGELDENIEIECRVERICH